MTAEQVGRALAPDVVYDVEVVDLVCVENTRGSAGGRVFPIEEIRSIRKVAQGANVPVHLDGARIFNASVASGVDVAEYAAEADTLHVLRLEGLGAPIGSLVCGTAEAIREARRIKILFGGRGGRRASSRPPASWPSRRAEAPARGPRAARRLAEGWRSAARRDRPAHVETNMVLVDTDAVASIPSRSGSA